MWPKALVKAARSGLTLSRQKDDTRQFAPPEGRASGAIGCGQCTSIGRMSLTTLRSFAAFSVQAEGLLETILINYKMYRLLASFL